MPLRGWTMIKAWSEEKGTNCTSPVGCFQEAYHQGLIEFEDTWMAMVKMRNKTVHTYDEKLAEEVYAALPGFLTQFKKLGATLEKK